MHRPKAKYTWITSLIAVGILIASTILAGAAAPVRAAESPTATILPEGHDFATQVLRDAWDMSEFTDISQYLNQSGQANYLQNISVQNGVFSARSTDLSDAQFFPLFPGYDTAMLVGKVGHNYPINASQYHCLYLAMKVDSGAPAPYPDQFQVMWFANEHLNSPGAAWGYSKGIALYPEAGGAAPSPTWKLYKVDLSASTTYWGGSRWTDQASWQGLRIDPTLQANVNFTVDWVRLTDCSPVNYDIHWSGPSASIWLQPQGTNREIQIEPAPQSSPYHLDTEGIAPGVYTYLVKNGSQVLDSGTFEINTTPAAKFARPSFTSGTDYATQAGNPWDFNSSSDVAQTSGLSYSLHDSLMDMVTAPLQTDPTIELNSPQVIPNSSAYRYLTFRMYTDPLSGNWQNVPQAMVARWIWRVPGASGRSGYECHLVSQDIPFDIGWQTYTVDLSDAFQGSAEEVAGDCGGLPRHWTQTSPVVRMRFDPNENYYTIPLHQELDWIKLTQVDRVSQGKPFPVQISLNKAPQNLRGTTFYYTDNLGQPKQHPAQQYNASGTAGAPAPAFNPNDGNFHIFLPLSTMNYTRMEFPALPNGVNFAWDTASVPPGEYYLCVDVKDGYNEGVYCSEAPVQVAAP